MANRGMMRDAALTYGDQDDTCHNTVMKRHLKSRRWFLAQISIFPLAIFPAHGEEKSMLMLSVDRYASLLQGASFQIRIISRLPASGERGKERLQADDYGRIRVKGLSVDSRSRVEVVVRLPSGETFSAYCDLAASSENTFHIVVQPVSRLDQVVTRTSDRPGHVVETTTPQRTLIGITLQPVAFAPGVSG